MAAEQVIIEFISDTSALEPAIDQLEQLGKIDKNAAQIFKQTNQELAKRNQQLTQNAQVMAKVGSESTKAKNTIQDLGKSVKGVSSSFAQGFQEGVIDTLHEAGVSAEQFFEALKTGQTEVAKGAEPLRTKLKNLKADLAALELAGETNTQQFREMAAEAGRLDDAIGDASARIKHLGSDTRAMDGLISIASGAAGAFSAVQGAVALFGAESEEVQEVLLRVNAAMAIAQGLAQVQIVLEKQSAAADLVHTIATKAKTVATIVYNAVLSSTIALLGAATLGIGLLVYGIIKLVEWLGSTEEELVDVNAELENSNRFIESETKLISDLSEVEIARAKAAGASESKLIKLRQVAMEQEKAILLAEKERLLNLRSTSNATGEDLKKLNDQIAANEKAINDITHAGILSNIELRSKEAEEAKEASDKRLKAAKDAEARARALREQALQDEIAAIEVQLLKAEEGSAEELRLQKNLIDAKARLELEQEELTANEVRLIRERSKADTLALEKNYNTKIRAEAIAAQVALNNVQIASIKTSNEDKLLLQLSNIEFLAQQEIDAANGNAPKIKEIYAKRDADIRDTKKAYIEDAANYEINIEAAKGGKLKRQLDEIGADQKQKLGVRLFAIDQVTNTELKAGGTRLKALNKEFADKLISGTEYNLRYEQLVDEQAQIYENGEKKKREAIKQTELSEKEKLQKSVDLAIEGAKAVMTVLASLSDAQAAKDSAKIEMQRKQVADLKAVGAITEKEELARIRRIDQEERVLKNRQAKRDKDIAIFNSIISTSEAVVKALASSFPPYNFILAGIVGAMGIAQTAIIANKPLPQFARGKKGSYEGPGIVGETGPEIMETDGNRYLMQKKSVVWLKKSDRVYSPAETLRMMNKQLPGINKNMMGMTNGHSGEFDYAKLGREISKSIPAFGLNVNENGFKEWVKEGISTTNYLNNRRSF